MGLAVFGSNPSHESLCFAGVAHRILVPNSAGRVKRTYIPLGQVKRSLPPRSVLSTTQVSGEAIGDVEMPCGAEIKLEAE